ncbi:MAG: hypothetical protein WBC18_24645 [Ottowia sp.]|uniref:hypothetical protein n=1 Tax=Ottowia sp. TaxID=1898956 RepID=UPI003C712957
MPLSLLKLPHGDIVFENYEDEMVLLNLPEGIYFTLDRVNADGLLWLLSAPSGEAALEAVRARHAGEAGEIETGLTQLMELLTSAGLALPRAEGEPGLTLDIGPAQPGSRYAPPRLERYDDIEDILKFDPVHEVTEAGWPTVRADATGQG